MNFKPIAIALIAVASLTLMGCTQEQQNKLGRDIQNWTGTNGVLEVYAGDKVARRFLKVDKLSTAMGTDDNRPRAYRFGYGVLDENLNFRWMRARKRCTSRSATTRPTCSSRTRAKALDLRSGRTSPTRRPRPAATAGGCGCATR
jgi:hypothetical protein